jgi:hypothetical protein
MSDPAHRDVKRSSDLSIIKQDKQVTLIQHDSLDEITESEYDIMTNTIVFDEELDTSKRTMYATITISDTTVDAYMDQLLSEDIICVLGIHTLVVIPSIVPASRVRMEYTALCYMSKQSGLYLRKNPNLTDEERSNTSDSMIAVVSRSSFRLFQCMHLGLIQYRRFKHKYQMAVKEGLNVRDVMIINESLGEIKWPTAKDFDEMFRMTRYTIDVFEQKDHIHLTYKHFRLPPYFYIQAVEKWQ